MRLAKTNRGKILFLLLLGFGLCALLPMASFSAKSPVSRPIYIEGTGTILDVLSEFPWTYFSEGTANHLGKHKCVCKFFSETQGHCMIYAANGDQLFFEMNGPTMTVKGGTGRFEGASGSWDSTITSESYSWDPWGGLVYSCTYEGEGTIVY